MINALVKSRRRRSQNAVTLHHVAKRAGVSPMTVSRVIGGQANVSEQARARVNKAIEELGYSPNAAARSLASAGALKIGLLYGNPSANYTSEFLIGMLENSGHLGCQLVLGKCDGPKRERPAADKLIKGGVDGVILPTPLCDSRTLLQRFDSAAIPTVAVGTGREDGPGLSVRIDNFRAAHEMTSYLLSLGHRKIGFILGHPRQIDSTQRYDGFAAALKEAGLEGQPAWVKQGYYTYRSGLIAAESLLSHADRPTAIFASNDEMAAGALAAAHKMKLDVPKDLSIVGFDDTPLASAIWPSLTTIRQPVDTLTRSALSLLLGEIRRRRDGKNKTAPHREVAKLTLVKRESTAPPPKT